MPRHLKFMIHASRAALAVAIGVAALSAAAQIQRLAPAPPGCGETHNTYGPFDYRTAQQSQRWIVEIAHFTHGVETLTKGATGPFGGDIGYTLAVFPNHPRAIQTLERLVEKQKADPAPGTDMTVECYYARGIAFAPDDLVFRMFYVSYLIRRNRPNEARKFLDYAAEKGAESPLTQFNAGMLFFDMKDYDRALAQAHRAIAMGMTRTELRDRLKAVGRWKDPEPVEVLDAAASAAQSASAVASQPSR